MPADNGTSSVPLSGATGNKTGGWTLWLRRLGVASLVLGAGCAAWVGWLAVRGVATVSGVKVPLAAYTGCMADSLSFEWSRPPTGNEFFGIGDVEGEASRPVSLPVQWGHLAVRAFMVGDEVVRYLVDKELVRQEVARRRLSITPEEAERHVAYLRIIHKLKPACDPAEDLQTWRELTLYDRLQHAVAGEIRLTPEEVKAWYAQRAEWQHRPEEYEIRRLMVGDEVQANNLYGQLRRGVPFNALERRYSLTHHAFKPGGEVMWWTPRTDAGRPAPLKIHDRVISALRPGEFSRPYKAGNAWWVVQVLAHHPGGAVPVSWVKSRIEEQLGDGKRAQAFNAWLENRRQGPDITYAWGFAPWPREAMQYASYAVLLLSAVPLMIEETWGALTGQE